MRNVTSYFQKQRENCLSPSRLTVYFPNNLGKIGTCASDRGVCMRQCTCLSRNNDIAVDDQVLNYSFSAVFHR